MNDEDILPEQAVAALKLVKQLGFKPDQIYGHGKINPGHKAATEGMTIKKFIDRNYNQPEFLYDYSDFPESKRPKPEWQDWSQYEVDSEFEKIIDKFGVEDIANVSSESDCENFIKEFNKYFGDGHIVKKDNFCDSLLLGLPIKDFVESAKDIEKEEEKNKKEEEEKKKAKEEIEKVKKEIEKVKEKETKLTEELKNFKRFIK